MEDIPDEQDEIKKEVVADKERLEQKEKERFIQTHKDKISFSFSWIAIIIRGIVGTCIAIFVFTQTHRIEDENTVSQFLLLTDHNDFVIQENVNSLIINLKYAGSLYSLLSKVSDHEFTEIISPQIKTKSYVKEIEWHSGPLSPDDYKTGLQKYAETALEKNIVVPYFEPGSDPDKNGPLMVTLFVPIKNQADQSSIGLVSATINFSELIMQSISPEHLDSTDIYVFRNINEIQQQLIYFFNAAQNPNPTIPASLKDALMLPFSHEQTISIGEEILVFVYVATPIYTEHTWQATIAASIAVLITSFIVVTAWILLEIEKRQFSNVLHEEHIQEIEGTIDMLEMTKNRLVAQENLASLGGLTAGIAHEIKNPLNFINNFSTLSIDLINEIDSFLIKYQQVGTNEERKDIYESISNLKQNISTIHEQGKRADNTIQRMLAHSRGKPGEWGLTDIHKLIDEYINLSYHGMRAKNSNFNVKIEKDFDPGVKEIEVVGNDMSRVFLNLLNNAFQSIEEKQRKAGAAYNNPTVSVKTQIIGNYLRIKIRDNGTGIEEKNKGNIFTPFFTTKPTGQGTGLGLSLSYNIIVREHGGSLTFDSTENEYCEFIITIPLQRKKEEVLA